MRTQILLFLILAPSLLFADNGYPYTWEANRKRYSLSAEEEKSAEIVLKSHTEYGYVFENDQFVMYSVYHRIIRVNSDEAVQRHNRISISMDRTLALVEVRARAINAKGEAVTFDNNNLKEIKEEDRDESSKIFAVEGVETGSEIEYYYIKRMVPFMYGTAYLQMDVALKECSFKLSCPRHLIFDFKSYNGFPKIKSDTIAKENVYTATAKDVPASVEQPFGYHIARSMRLEFKLAYNTAKSRARLYTWADAGKQFYNSLYNVRKEDQKPLEKFVKELKDDPSKPVAARIRNVERAIKTGIQLEEQRDDDALEEIASILKYKVASRYGMTTLFLQTFDKLGIKVEPVITCNREHGQFDESFDTWGYLDEYVFYFPEANGFLSPYNVALSYPLIDTKFIHQYGLFLEPIQVGTVRSALTSVRQIPATPHTLSADNLDIKVSFNKDLSQNTIELKRIMRGYNATFIAPFYHLMNDQEKVALADDILKQTAPGLSLTRSEGKVTSDAEVDQFELDAAFSSAHFIERAGPRILFKAGLLIGPQSELYRDDKRTIPVENDYNRGYERTIQITIPDGYSIKNPTDLNFNVVYKDGEATPFEFISSHRIEGQLLTITINEYYKQIEAPLERYEDYRKVINAAADFNKVVLVLEKKA